MDFQTFFQKEYMGNTMLDFIIFFAAIFVVFFLRKTISKFFINLLYRFFARVDQGVGREQFQNLLLKPVNWLVLLFALFVASDHLHFPKSWNLPPPEEFGINMILDKGFTFLLVIVIFWALLRMVDYIGLIFKKRADKTESKLDDQIIPFVVDSLKVVVILIGVFVLVDNVFDQDLVGLAAGLGIGGVAIALASKESLENLLGSFTIFLDQPFTVGDRVKVGSVDGFVEKVGFRSTRIRTLDKSFVTVPNKNMVNVELDNLSLRTFRREEFYVGLTYETSAEQIKAIVKDIQELIDNHEQTTQEGQVRFMEFGASSLDIMVLYYVDTTKWTTFINVKQDINYKVMDIVKKHGSDFAFPSTSVYLHKNE